MAITFGAEALIQSAATSDIKVAMLDDSHAIIAYVDEAGGANSVRAVIALIDGSGISYGTEYTVNGAWSMSVGLGVLDSTHAVITYYDSGNGGFGTARIAQVSGSTISFGSEYTFNSDVSYINQVGILDSTHFAVAFNDYNSGQFGASVIGVVSGTTIAFGTKVTFNTNATTEVSIAGLDSTHFVVSYQESGGWNGRSIVGVVSNEDDITFGSYYTFNAGGTGTTSTATLDSTHFIVTYRDNSVNYGRAIIGTLSSGNVIAFGSEYTFNAANTAYTAVASLDSTHAIVAYEDIGDLNYGKAITATISNGDDIALGSEDTFNSATTTWNAITTLSSSKVIIVYRDEGNLNYGTAIIAATASTTGKTLSETISQVGQFRRGVIKILSGACLGALVIRRWVGATKVSNLSLAWTVRRYTARSFGADVSTLKALIWQMGKRIIGSIELNVTVTRFIAHTWITLSQLSASTLYALPPPVLDVVSKVGACLYLSWT